MKKTLLFAAVAALFAIASCQKDTTPVLDQNGNLVFTATISRQNTKTEIDTTNGKVSWLIGDEITITDGAQVSVKYVSYYVDTVGTAWFERKSGESLFLGDGPYTAVYGTAPATTQTFSTKAKDLPMSAASNDTKLTFTVSCGLLDLNLTAGESITSIEVKGTPTGGSETTYTLNCPDTVSLASGVSFYFALPAGTYTSFLINGLNGAICKKEKTGSSIAITANHITPVSFKSLIFGIQLWAGGPYWATTNIGANKESDLGQYFAWGYTDGCVRNASNNGWVLASDGSTVKQFNDTYFPDKAAAAFKDAAATICGGNWHMPKTTEYSDLIDPNKTTLIRVKSGTEYWEKYKVKGMLIKGKNAYASKSIFLPASGCGYYNDLDYLGENGYYFSNESYNDEKAYSLGFLMDSDVCQTISIGKSTGRPIRPVCSSL